MWTRITLVGLSLLLAGPLAAQELTGTYRLRSLAGSALPAVPTPAIARMLCDGFAPQESGVVAQGMLVATRNGEFRLVVESEAFCPPVDGMGRQAVLERSGLHAVRGSSLSLASEQGTVAATLSADGSRVEFGGLLWQRVSAVVDPELWTGAEQFSEPGAELRRERAAAFMETLDGEYRCARDPLLRDSAAAEPLAPAVAASIAAAAPGWRVPTERELACGGALDALMGELRGAHPIEAIPAFGSGRRWWLLRGDFDADGRTDVAALVVPAGAASSSRWVVLFASGRAQVIAQGALFTVAQAGSQIAPCSGASATLRGDALTDHVRLWRWNGQTLSPVQVAYCDY